MPVCQARGCGRSVGIEGGQQRSQRVGRCGATRRIRLCRHFFLSLVAYGRQSTAGGTGGGSTLSCAISAVLTNAVVVGALKAVQLVLHLHAASPGHCAAASSAACSSCSADAMASCAFHSSCGMHRKAAPSVYDANLLSHRQMPDCSVQFFGVVTLLLCIALVGLCVCSSSCQLFTAYLAFG